VILRQGALTVQDRGPRSVHEHADAPHPYGLLRARRKRPSGCRAAEQADELAPLHSITSRRGRAPRAA
jgi:hypothetical protein